MSADRELMLTRLIDAPRERAVLSGPDRARSALKQWFSPLPSTTPSGAENERARRAAPA